MNNANNKQHLRRVFREVKKKYLSESGNFNHSALRNNLIKVLQNYREAKVIGSYINVPER